MKPKTLALLGLPALFIVILVFAWFFHLSKPAPAPAPLPNPNGYDDFMKAGRMAAETAGAEGKLTDFQQLEPAGLRAELAPHAEALRLLRRGLTRQSAVPVETVATNLNAILPEMGNAKRLAVLLAAEGWLFELENRPAEAARCYLDLIQFGNDLSRGGFLIIRLVGIACEARGCAALAKLPPRLKPDELRAVLGRLSKLEESRVQWSEVMESEKRFARIQIGRAYNPLVHLVARAQIRKAVASGEAKHNRIVAQERLLGLELALHGYRAENGKAPARLEELVPAYLPAVPPDPFGKGPPAYRPDGTNWLLYSVGMDRKDDGGKPVRGGLTNQGDLFFNSPH
jgi:hypothetical protein